ncbi:maleylpyruvate isomerase N-terminal domain-containing protein [Catellatospora sp. NPDC049609]|uniref:maleylpyruvate isomerase N-terminal domain-containing protein n=1 Tax=Catellatospora sp. NPDC049609 TaxID=3155505 RepID=UPI003432B317
MRDPDHTDLDQALRSALTVLRGQAGADWTVPAGPLDWTCRDTAAHIAHDLLAYAGQLAAAPDDAYLPCDLTVRPHATVAQILQIMTASGGLLSTALAAADPALRAWHWGPCDPSGFAAMGMAETLLHTHDITQGLRAAWTPPADLAALVLHRLFPDAPDGDPTAVLLWCTGRGELPGHARRTEWSWRAARP